MKIFKRNGYKLARNEPAVLTDEMASIVQLHTFMIQMLARGESLRTVLELFTLKLEEHFKRKTYCSLLMVADGNRLVVEQAPNLPLEYQQAIHSLKPGPKAGSCGTAVYRKETVIVSDIEKDPLWADFRADALPFGLRACWSVPILIDGHVAGTFAVYHSEICTPAAHEIDILETCASLAGLAIEREQRIKLAQQLQESEQRFKSLFDYYPHSIYVFSLEGHFSGFNRGTEPLSGYSKEELLGTPFLPLVVPEDQEKVLHCFHQAKKGTVQRCECNILHKNGYQLVISLTYLPIMVNGEAVGVYGIGRDVTHEKQLEQQLQATHKEMAHLFKNHQGAIFKFKKENGRFIHTFGGGQLLKKCGLKPEDWIGKSLADFMAPEAASRKEFYYEQAWNGMETSYEGNLNGIHYLAVVTPVFQDGQVAEVIVSCNDITELKKVHEELQETKELLESFANNTADAISTMNVQGQLTYVNQAYVDLFGWQKNELLGKELPNVPDLYKKELNRLTQLTFSENKINRFETERQRKDGSLIPVSVTQSPLKDKNGVINGTSAIIRDVTEQKQIEQELKENRQRYQSLFYANPDVVYSVDTNGLLINVNLSIYKILGYTPANVKGMHWEKFVEKSYLRKARSWFELALQGNPQTFELDLIHQNGQRVTFQVTNMPIFVNNEIVGVHGIAKDITKQKQSQQEILHLKQQLELVLNSVGEGIYVMDKSSEIKLINPAGARMLGYEVHELIGKSPKDTFLYCDESEFCKTYKTLMDGAVRSVTDEFFLKKDGTSLPADYVASPIWENGKISGVVVTFRDISEKKMAEEYLLKSAKLEMAGQLAAGVAHEIRNPLTSIQGFIRLMEETDKKVPEYFSIIRSEFERIEGIISEFLTLAKPQAVNFEAENVGYLLHQTIHLMNVQAIMQGVEVVPDIDPALPLIQCDKHQLKQVFINVVKNAIEATVSKGKLMITCKKTESHLHIVFQDQGAGIPEDRIKHLFEPFYSTKEKGTGLGLMISYKIIEEHNGIMQIKSEEGKGTAVHILLPLPKKLPSQAPKTLG